MHIAEKRYYRNNLGEVIYIVGTYLHMLAAKKSIIGINEKDGSISTYFKDGRYSTCDTDTYNLVEAVFKSGQILQNERSTITLSTFVGDGWALKDDVTRTSIPETILRQEYRFKEFQRSLEECPFCGSTYEIID